MTKMTGVSGELWCELAAVRTKAKEKKHDVFQEKGILRVIFKGQN